MDDVCTSSRFIVVLLLFLEKMETDFWPSQFNYNGCEWTALRLCGKGTFSSCFHIRNNNGVSNTLNSNSELALKVYKKHSKYHNAFINERGILGTIKDILTTQQEFAPFFVKFFDSFTLLEHNCMVMELLGHNLEQLLIKTEVKRLSLYVVRKILHNLLSAVMFLENNGIVHGDIKPSNVLWNANSNCFQLVDFGLSFRIGQQPCQLLQSPGYQAPEVLEWNKVIANCSAVDNMAFVNQYSHVLNTAIDVWSIGCLIVYTSTGQQLYNTEHAQKLPFLCISCKSNSGYCIHSIGLQNIFSSNAAVLQEADIESFLNILCRFFICDSSKRLKPHDALSHQFLLSRKAQKLDVVDSILLPTRIIRLMNMFQTRDKDEKEDMICDIKEECEKLGSVKSITASNKCNFNEDYHVYVEFRNAGDSEKAQSALTGRQFNDKLVVATYFPVDDYLAGYFH